VADVLTLDRRGFETYDSPAGGGCASSHSDADNDRRRTPHLWGDLQHPTPFRGPAADSLRSRPKAALMERTVEVRFL
jgi:hypothetical protein